MLRYAAPLGRFFMQNPILAETSRTDSNDCECDNIIFCHRRISCVAMVTIPIAAAAMPGTMPT